MTAQDVRHLCSTDAGAEQLVDQLNSMPTAEDPTTADELLAVLNRMHAEGKRQNKQTRQRLTRKTLRARYAMYA